MINKERLRRTRSTVVLIDSKKLVEIELKANEIISASEHEYATEIDALRTVSSKYSRKLLVWCGLVTARVSRSVKSFEHPKVKRLADARYLAKAFAEDHFIATSGSVALSPNIQPEVMEHLATTKPQMVLSGMCVGFDQNGIWVRVGRRSVEATLVYEGKISGWIALCEGLDSVGQAIQEGTPAAIARSQLAERVVSEMRMAIMQWQRTRTVPSQIWLHGPGGDPSGEVHQALLLHSGCRVTPPNIKVPTTIELSQFTSLLPTVIHALDAPRIKQPQTVMKEQSADKKRRLSLLAALGVLVLVGMTVLSNWLRGSREEYLDDIENQLISLTTEVDNDIRAELQERKDTLNTLTLLEGEKYPDWTMLFRLAEAYPAEGTTLSVSSDRSRTSVNTTICCDGVASYEDKRKELDRWAKVIYGPLAQAESSARIQENIGRELRIGVTLGLPSG